MEGKPGSCQFVTNIKLYNEGGVSETRINDCKALFPEAPETCPAGVQNYTGWIYVTEATPRRFVKAPGAGTNIVEARGIPCFDVEVLPASATIDDAPANVAHTNYLTNGAADRIFQCHFQSQNNLEAVFLCQNNTGHCATIGTNTGDDKCNKPTAVFGPRSCWFAGGQGNALTRGVELSTHRGRILNQWFYMRAEPPAQADLKFRFSGPVNDTALHSWDREEFVSAGPPVQTQLVDAADVNGIVCNGGVRVLPAGQF
jgi:hypothetical protein